MTATKTPTTHLEKQPFARRWWALAVMTLGALVVFKGVLP